MGGSIGSVTFDDNLFMVDAQEPFRLITEKRALDGSLVQSRLTTVNIRDTYKKVKFTWVPYSTLEDLSDLAESNASFYVTLAAGSPAIGPCRFAKESPIKYSPVPPEEFFSPEAVAGYGTDLYNGECHLVVRL